MTRHMWIWLAVSALLFDLGWCYFDREPPTLVLPLPAGDFPPKGHPGEEIEFAFPAERNFSRNCSVTIQRSIVDSQGGGRQYGTEQRITHGGLVKRAELMGDMLKVKITIPATSPSGRAHLLTDSAWTCLRNPSTYIKPIDVSYDWPFDVLPPQAKTAIVIVGKD